MRKVLHILGSFSDEDVEWIATNAATVRIPEGDEVIAAGKVVDALYLVLEGQLCVRVGGRDGKDVARLYSGEIVGEMSFVDERPPEASVISSAKSRLLVVPSEKIKRKMEFDVGFSARFYRAIATFLADRLRTTTSHLGYGRWREDLDQTNVTQLDEASVAAIRFEHLLQRFADVDDRTIAVGDENEK